MIESRFKKGLGRGLSSLLGDEDKNKKVELVENLSEKFKNSIINWHQYDWGINDNFYVSVCELLNLPIFNIYKDVNIIKHENDFKTINENRDWQINSWNENQKYLEGIDEKFLSWIL